MSKFIASDRSLWHINNVSPPIPIRCYDWEWVSDDYGGPGDNSHGNESSENKAREAIEEWIEDNK